MMIQYRFPHGSIPPDTAEVHLADASEKVVLRLAFTRAGRFEAIPEPSLSDEDAQTLIKVIGEPGRTPTVWRVVLFASLPVKGTFRYRDRWQIRPVPDDAPKPSFAMAPHPFVLELKGSAVSEGFVRWLQGGKLLREVEQRGLTLLGIALANLEDDLPIQLCLPLERDDSVLLDAALDEIRRRFGSTAVTRAVLLRRRSSVTMPLLPD
jgi:hypothetical protein